MANVIYLSIRNGKPNRNIIGEMSWKKVDAQLKYYAHTKLQDGMKKRKNSFKCFYCVIVSK